MFHNHRHSINQTQYDDHHQDVSIDSLELNTKGGKGGRQNPYHNHQTLNYPLGEMKMGIEEINSSPPSPKRKLPVPRKVPSEDFFAVSVNKSSLNKEAGTIQPTRREILLKSPRQGDAHHLRFTAGDLATRLGSSSPPLNPVPFQQKNDPLTPLKTNFIITQLQKDQEQNEKQKLYEENLQKEIRSGQEQIIESLRMKEEERKKEFLKQKELHQQELQSLAFAKDEEIKQRNLEIQHLHQQLTNQHHQHSNKLKQVLDQQYEHLQEQEKKLQERFQQEKEILNQTILDLQEKLDLQLTNQLVVNKVELEAKEEILQKKYTKKLLKYEKKLEVAIKSYSEKELLYKGAADEIRNELLQTKTLYEVKEKQFYEELTLKDKRILKLEQDYNNIENYIYTAKVWKSLASELANLIIHTCATVEDLPDELWTSTTPGIFSSIYDEFHGIKNRPKTEANYVKKKQDFVIVQRLLLSKCLKYGKVVHLYLLKIFIFLFFVLI